MKKNKNKNKLFDKLSHLMNCCSNAKNGDSHNRLQTKLNANVSIRVGINAYNYLGKGKKIIFQVSKSHK